MVVLIVDDDEGVRFFHRIIVSQSKLSADPVCLRSAEEAYYYLDRNLNNTAGCLILLDINMPLMDGWDLLDKIYDHSYSEQVRVVMVTSSINRADREKAKLYDIVLGFVEKPISDEDCKKIMELPAMAGYFN